MDRHNISQSELAVQSRMDPSTLSRFLNAQDDRHLTQRSIRKLENFSGLIFGGYDVVELDSACKPTFRFSEADAMPFQLDDKANSLIADAVRTLCANRNSADPWTLKSRALESIGYHPGDVLIVDLSIDPVPGDVVCAQVYDFDKGGAETVFRSYQPPCLISATHDARLLRPYLIDTAGVTIRGVVVASLRDPRMKRAA